MLGYCRHRGLGLIAYSPLMDGHLARPVGTETTRTKSIAGTFFEKRRRESDKQIIARVEELAKKKGVSMAQISLAWIFTKVTAPIVGTTSIEKLADLIDALDVKLSEEDIKFLEEEYKPLPIAGHS